MSVPLETVIGLLTIVGVLLTIMMKKLSPLVALTVIPLAAALVLGEGSAVGGFMLDGMVSVAPMAAMFLFAILFFSVVGEAGLFEPAIRAVLRYSGNHPPRLAVGTALLASMAHLDGSGASTFLICIPALLPIYDRLQLDRRMLACIVAMAAGVGNMLPWGGPTIRAATALDVPVMELFAPVIPAYLAGVASVLAFSWFIGTRQKVFAGSANLQDSSETAGQEPAALGWRFWINLVTVIAVIAALLTALLPPAGCFLLGLVVALAVNYGSLEAQGAAIERHAPSALTMVAILFAAGVFTGIMRGTGMIEQMAASGGGLLPEGSANYLSTIVAVTSMPLSLLFDPDSFYFGILPLLGEMAQQSGVPPVEIARAAILGQMTTGFPVSPMTPATFLLVGLAGVDLGDHQRYTIPYLFALSLIMTGVALATGAIGP